jgi:Lrp/AsnC family transcriptional regulator for asnA, asnC and gidA
MKIDKTDLNILHLLKDNGRIQNNEIASRLSISEGTVRNRIKKLIDNNFLSIRGLVNPCMIKNKQVVIIGINISKRKDLESAPDLIAKLDYVTSVYMVSGRYDLLVELFIEPTSLLNFLSIDLAEIDHIATTESFIVLKSWKRWI